MTPDSLSEILCFRRVQQMPAASLVERTKFCAAGAGCGSKRDDTAVAGAAHGAESADAVGLLPRSRSAFACRATGGACRLRVSPAPGAGEKLSRMDRGSAHHQR